MAEISGCYNFKFLKRISPIKVILWAFTVWAILFFTAPLKLNIAVNTDAYILIFFSVLAFILGALLYKREVAKIIIPKSEKHLKKLFNIILLLALVGLMAKFFDRFFIRGISLEADYFSNRETMDGAGGNPLAIVSALLTPMGIIPLFIFWKYKLKLKFFLKILTFILFFAQIFDALLLGSRSILFVLFILFGLYLAYFKKVKFNFWKTLFSVTSVILFMLVMNFIFVERTKAFAGDNTYEIVLNESNFNYTLTSSQDFKQNFRNMNSAFQTAAFTYITTVQYFTHGMIEFSYLYSNFRKDYSLGGYTFALYDRFFSKITGSDFNVQKIQELAPRQGVYTTFFGPLYLDFGWLTILFMFLFGKLARNIYELSIQGSDWATLIYFYFFIVLMFSPVFNFVNGAGGLFILTSLILFKILSNKYYSYEYV